MIRRLAVIAVGLAVGAGLWLWRGRLAGPPRPVATEYGLALVHDLRGVSVDDEFGHSAASCPDLDGDGVPDFAVTAPTANLPTGAEAGLARTHSGRTGAVLQTFGGDGEGWIHGHAVACLSDVDGDHVAEVAVGLIGNGRVGGAGGGVRVFSGRTGAPLFALSGETDDDHFGARIANAGDVDGDGADDLIVGAPGLYTGNIVGYARVHSGRDGRPLHALRGAGEVGDRFGYAVAGAGDVDGDGRADLAVGALADDDGGEHAGAVYVFSGASGERLRRIPGERAWDELGHDLALVHDVDGDGVRDLLVGAFARERPSFARVYSPVSGAVLQQVTSDREGDAFGHSVGAAGDVNADGVPDWAVGAPDAPVGEIPRVGRVLVYSGRDAAPIAAFDGHRERGHLGYVVRGVGDLTGDGYGELLVGASLMGERGRALVLSPCRLEAGTATAAWPLTLTATGAVQAEAEAGTLELVDGEAVLATAEAGPGARLAAPVVAPARAGQEATLTARLRVDGRIVKRSAPLRVRFCR